MIPTTSQSPWRNGLARMWIAAGVVCLLIAASAGMFWWMQGRRLQAPLSAIAVSGPHQALPGSKVELRVAVRDPKTGSPQPGTAVEVRAGKDDAEEKIGTFRTDADGFALVPVTMPSDAQPSYLSVLLIARGPGHDAGTSWSISVGTTPRTFLSTDKPLYQPGQIVHVRSMTLADDRKPLATSPIELRIQDPKGTRVMQANAVTSEFGIASFDFETADDAIPGSYEITAKTGGRDASTRFTLARYVLPRFKVSVDAPSSFRKTDRIRGEIRAVYTFGEPLVRADVVVKLTTSPQAKPSFEVKAATDANGVATFEFPDTGAARKWTVVADVAGPDGETQSASLPVEVRDWSHRVEVVPERPLLISKLAQELFVTVSSHDGSPSVCEVGIPSLGIQARTGAQGIARLQLPPRAEGALAEPIVTRCEGSEPISTATAIATDPDPNALLVRTDKSLYPRGSKIGVRVLSARNEPCRVRIDAVHQGRSVASATTESAAGAWDATLTLPDDAAGKMEIQAARLDAPDPFRGGARLVQVGGHDLLLDIRSDKPQYRPAERAVLDISSRRADGTPERTALGIAGVDESIFAILERRPGLEVLFFAVEPEEGYSGYDRRSYGGRREPGVSRQRPVDSGLLIDPRPEAEERRLVALAAATPVRGMWHEPPQNETAARNELEREVESRRDAILGWTWLSPFVLAILAMFPVFFHAWRRLTRQRPVPEATDYERASFLQATRMVMAAAVMIWLTPALLIVGLLFFESKFHISSKEMMVLLSVLSTPPAIGISVMMLVGVLRTRHTAVGKALPPVRDAWTFLPASTFLSLCGLAAVFAAPNSHLRAAFDHRMDRISWVFIVVVLAWQLLFVMLSVTRQTAVRQAGSIRRWWLVVSRLVVVGVPLTLVAVFFMVRQEKKWSSSDYDYYEVAESSADNKEGGTGTRAKGEEGSMGRPSAGAGRRYAPGADSEAAPEPSAPEARVRKDFPETLLWLPEVVTGKDGHATVQVPLADSITTWRVSASALSAQGRLGAATAGIVVTQDFFVDALVPIALTRGDEVTIPVTVHNHRDEPQNVRVELEQRDWLQVIGAPTAELKLAPQQVKSVSMRMRAISAGKQTLAVRATSPLMADAVERPVEVLPDGRPVELVSNGRLSTTATSRIDIPEEAIEGASELRLKVYPDVFGQVAEGLEGIFRMPYGCFEQTSSTTYPSVLALDFLQRTKRSSPDVEAKAKRFIGIGYQRLLSFEVMGGGFEWFGHAPAHVVLSAYGLLEFTDMKRVYPVDPDVLQRTKDYLLRQQQSDGWWEEGTGHGVSSAVQTELGDRIRTTSFVVWALAESGEKGSKVATALDLVARGEVEGASDPYALALRANALLAGGRQEEAERVLQALDSAVAAPGAKDVALTSESSGITRSRGSSLQEELAGLAAHAMFRSGKHQDTARRLVAYLGGRRTGWGTWSSTQATIAALRAILDEASASPAGEQVIAARVNGESPGEVRIPANARDVMRSLPLSKQVRKGGNAVELQLTGGGEVTWQLAGVYYLPWKKQAAADERIRLRVSYGSGSARVGTSLPCEAEVSWLREQPASMGMIEVGVPPGFEPDRPDLEGLVKTKVIERYSASSGKVTLYARGFSKGQPLRVKFRLRATFPAKVLAPPSRAWPYYEPEIVAESNPVRVTAQ